MLQIPKGFAVSSRGETNLGTDNGQVLVSVEGGQPIPIAGVGRTFEQETLAHAQFLMPTAGFDRVMGTDCTPIWDLALSAANTPTIDQFWTGGVVQFSAAGANQVALNPVTPGGATYNSVIGNSFRSRVVPWFIRAREYIGYGLSAPPGSLPVIFTPGKELVLLSLNASYVGGAGTGHCIELVGMGSVHPTQVQLRLGGNSFAPGPTNVSVGQDGNLGAYNSLMPVNSFFDVALYFDGTKLYWAFSGNYNNPANQLDAAKGQLLSMGQDCGAVTVNSSATPDITIGAGFKLDALACAYASETGGKF